MPPASHRVIKRLVFSLGELNGTLTCSGIPSTGDTVLLYNGIPISYNNLSISYTSAPPATI